MMKQTVQKSTNKPTYKNYQSFLNNYGNNNNSNNNLQRKEEIPEFLPERRVKQVYKTEKHVEIVEIPNCDKKESNSAINNVSKNNSSSITSEETIQTSTVSQRIADFQEFPKQKSENSASVNNNASQVSAYTKIFETKTKDKQESNSNALGERISQFEKPKIKPKTFTPAPIKSPVPKTAEVPLPTISPPPPVQATASSVTSSPALNEQSVGKLQATLASQNITLTFDNPDGVDPKTLDRNDPLAKKVANGALRNLYGNYHQKSNNIVAAMPSEMVQKDSNISQIIQNLASNGDLEKLSGRVLPPKTLEE